MATGIALAYYENNGNCVTGLTPLVTVYRVALADLASSAIVSAQAMTEIGDGIYAYRLASLDFTLYWYPFVAKAAGETVDAEDVAGLVHDFGQIEMTAYGVAATGDAMTLADDAITSAKFDESTAFPLKATDSGSTYIARTGADGDTLETLSDEIAVVDGNVDAILADTGTDGVVLANDAITSAKFDESTAYPLASADSGSTQIARTGADGDTLETLSDQMDDLAPASTALTNATWTDARAAKLDYLDASVDDIGAQVQAQNAAAGYEAGDMNFTLFCTYDETITGLTIPSNWSKLYYSVKDKDTDTEDEAILRIVVTNGGAVGDGLLRIMGQAPTVLSLTAANASLTADQSAGTLGVLVSDDALSVITPSPATDGRKYDVKVVEDDGTSFRLAHDDAIFTATRTRATS